MGFVHASEKSAGHAEWCAGGVKNLQEEVALMRNESVTEYEELSAGMGGSLLAEYELGAVVKRSPAGAVYETAFCGHDGETRPAVIKVRELEAEAAMTAVRQYRNAMTLEHPHLLRLYTAGGACSAGVTTAWVVMERADESLAGVLAERALTEDEVGEMLRPTVAALAYLHQNGFAHAALKPSNVLAAGDQLKLSCDNAVRVSDGGVPVPDIRAEDIRALGVLITDSLTERGPYGVIRHPAGRFAEIVRHCSEPDPAKRWTAEQIAAHLERKVDQKVQQKDAEPVPETAPATAPPRGFPKWVPAGLAALVLVVLLAAALRRGSQKPAPGAPSPAAAPASEVIQAAPAPQLPKRKPFPQASHSSGRKADGWYVVIAAYGSHDAAEKRMNSLANRWPAFRLNVSDHNSERAPWLVTLGENLSEDEAETLRARAVRDGIAGDAYIKRIK